MITHVHAIPSRAADSGMKMLLSSLLLGHNLAGIELNEHGAICFELLHRNGETEVVEDQELKLKMVELNQRQTSNLNDDQQKAQT